MVQNIKNKVLRAISFIAHPVFIFPILTTIYFQWGQISSFLAVFGLSFLAPFIYFIYLYKKGEISNFDVTERTQRYKLFFAVLIGLVLSIIYLYFFSSEEIFHDFSRLLMIAVVLILFNFKIKVSIHAALITLFCFSLVQDFNIHPAIFLLIPLVAYSRFALKRHRPIELVLGFLIPSLFYL